MTVEQWLDNNPIAVKIWYTKYRNGDETFEQWLDRVSGFNPKIRQLILDKKFLFGGRTLANRGLNNGSYANCYSHGFIGDTLEEIMQANTDLALTYRVHGGQGLSVSKIRPKGAPIGTRYQSDGIIPFMKLFNQTTDTISQGGCIAEDELVQTETGYKPIKDVKAGDKVWTKKGFIPILEVLDKGEQPVVRVTTKKGYSIRTTPDHKFAFNGFDKKPIKDFNPGECVSLIAGHCDKNVSVDKAAYIVANYYANGYINAKNNSGTISTAYKNVAEKLVEYFKDLGYETKILSDPNVYRVRLTKDICTYLSSLGIKKSTCHTIQIPDWIMQGNDSTVASFFCGLLDSDGTVYKTSWKYSTVCKEFAEQILKLVSRIGGFPTLSITYRHSPKHDLYNVADSFRINYPQLHVSEKVQLKDSSAAKNSRYTTPYTKNILGCGNCVEHLKKIANDTKIGLYTFLQINTKYAPIISDTIDEIVDDGKCHVYDLVLPEEHLFNCNGFYVSNSRKGALMMSCDVWHKQIEDFITVKSTEGAIEKANLSVEIDDEFMNMVDRYIEYGEHPIKHIVRDYNGHIVEYDVDVAKIYDLICDNALKHAEPGIIFTNKFRHYNLMQYVPGYNIETSNPCGGCSPQ